MFGAVVVWALLYGRYLPADLMRRLRSGLIWSVVLTVGLALLAGLAAWLVGWGTVVGGRTWTAVFTGPVIPALLAARVVGWARRAVPEGGFTWSGRPSGVRIGIVTTVTIVLVRAMPTNRTNISVA